MPRRRQTQSRQTRRRSTDRSGRRCAGGSVRTGRAAFVARKPGAAFEAYGQRRRKLRRVLQADHVGVGLRRDRREKIDGPALVAAAHKRRSFGGRRRLPLNQMAVQDGVWVVGNPGMGMHEGSSRQHPQQEDDGCTGSHGEHCRDYPILAGKREPERRAGTGAGTTGGGRAARRRPGRTTRGWHRPGTSRCRKRRPPSATPSPRSPESLRLPGYAASFHPEAS